MTQRKFEIEKKKFEKVILNNLDSFKPLLNDLLFLSKRLPAEM